MVEILAPVGNKENLISAINAGADAVYLGLKDFSARKTAQNFDFDELRYAVAYAKTFNVKVYVTVNTLIKDSEINDFLSAVNVAYSLGVDAFILQDVFLGKYVKEIMPDVVLHLSTQAGVCNKYGAILAKNYGFSRVILARETKIEDIKDISKIIETEVFIQGALCTSLSGHCYFSSFIGGNSGNRGLCKQPCRKKYRYLSNEKTVTDGYSLSLADLSVNEDIFNLIKLGVKSFKIEGRLRSKEYVSSAVKYYKTLINGKKDDFLYDLLKISFNRGDYTKGLAVFQDANFISSKIQNNKGLKFSKIIKVSKNEIFVSNKNYTNGDSFKVLRNDFEVGSATVNDGNILYNGDVKVGDYLYITKKSDLLSLLNLEDKRALINVSVNCRVGFPLEFSSNGITVKSSYVVEPSKSSPILKSDIISNLNKTDIYPYKVSVEFNDFDDNAFIPKGVVNNLRAELFSNLFYKKIYKKPYNIEEYKIISNIKNNRNIKSAVIVTSLNDIKNYDYIIYFPNDYNNIKEEYFNNVFLYIPPFASGKDIEIIKSKLKYFAGIYADGVWALELSKEYNIKLFAGLGFNVFNQIDYKYLKNEDVFEISASKELSFNDARNLGDEVFLLSSGLIEVMDLIYCPFGKNCKNCKINENIELCDYENRKFPVKRYKISECRFKVYNNARLIEVKNANKIVDLSKELPKNVTNGNYQKGVK